MTDRADRPDDSRQGSPPSPQAGAPRPLDRVPGERYRASAAEPPARGQQPATSARAVAGGRMERGRNRAIGAGALAATAGALVYAALGYVDLGPGLIAVAGFVGWVVALAVTWGAGGPLARRWLIAAVLAAAAIVVGLLLAWGWSRVGGGVLGPLEYTEQRYGPLAYVEILVAAGVAALRGR